MLFRSPNTVTSIGNYAFYGCTSLSELNIGEGVTTIGEYAFWNCPNLATVHFNATNCTQMYTKINTNYNSVFNIGTSNDGATPIVTLTIGDYVTRIPDYAFRNSTNMSIITIPNSTTSIGQYSFAGCSSITSISSWPITPPEAQSNSFNGINTSITVYVAPGSSNTYKNAQGWNRFSNFEVLKGSFICSTGQTLYYKYIDSDNISITYPGSSSSDPWPTSTDKPAGDIIIQDSIELHDLGSNLTKLFAVKNIDNYAFVECNNITSVTIPNTVTSIGNYAFYGCTSLSELNIGEGVTTIGDRKSVV